MLAEMALQVDAARLLTWRAARMRDGGQPINAAASMAKWHASDTAMRVTTDAVQVFGGAGYSRDNPVERLMRDAKGAQIYEGTNQIHRLIVAQQLLDGMRHEG
jgi:butyryl-CoA dehydrogenase